MSQKIVHGACGRSWTGLSVEHCPACHENFSGTTAGDRHRVNGVCLNPAEIKNRNGEQVLVEKQRPGFTVWGRPGTFNPRESA